MGLYDCTQIWETPLVINFHSKRFFDYGPTSHALERQIDHKTPHQRGSNLLFEYTVLQGS